MQPFNAYPAARNNTCGLEMVRESKQTHDDRRAGRLEPMLCETRTSAAIHIPRACPVSVPYSLFTLLLYHPIHHKNIARCLHRRHCLPLPQAR